jgi:hypothetical protein
MLLLLSVRLAYTYMYIAVVSACQKHAYTSIVVTSGLPEACHLYIVVSSSLPEACLYFYCCQFQLARSLPILVLLSVLPCRKLSYTSTAVSSGFPEARLCFYCIVVSFGLPGARLQVLLLSVPCCPEFACVFHCSTKICCEKKTDKFIILTVSIWQLRKKSLHHMSETCIAHQIQHL